MKVGSSVGNTLGSSVGSSVLGGIEIVGRRVAVGALVGWRESNGGETLLNGLRETRGAFVVGRCSVDGCSVGVLGLVVGKGGGTLLNGFCDEGAGVLGLVVGNGGGTLLNGF